MTIRSQILLCLATLMALAGPSHVSLAQKGGAKNTTPKLSLTISPMKVLEGNSATGTVSHNNASTASAVTIALSSNDNTEATLPSSVTIPAGSSSAIFTVTALDDNTVDGPQNVVISAAAAGYTSSSASITVSDKLPVEYRTEVVPAGNNGNIWINGITNNSRVYGWMAQMDGTTTTYSSGYVYDQGTQVMYDLNQISHLTSQVQQLVGPDFEFSSVVGMNESGLMTGYLTNSPYTIRRGFVIDPTVDGKFSPDPADWVVQLLPSLGSTYSYGRRINELGDVGGIFQRADGTYGAFFYNPWRSDLPKIPSVNLGGGGTVVLNDVGEMAGVDNSNRAFLYDATTDTIQYFNETSYSNISGLNNSGVFSGRASITVAGTRRNQTTTTSVAFRHDGAFRPVAQTSNAASTVSLNEAGDLACLQELTSNSMLSHRGFSPDNSERIFSLAESIAADDPLKTQIMQNEPTGAAIDVFAINDRDITGYPQVVVRMMVSNSSQSGNFSVAIILTPYLVP